MLMSSDSSSRSARHFESFSESSTLELRTFLMLSILALTLLGTPSSDSRDSIAWKTSVKSIGVSCFFVIFAPPLPESFLLVFAVRRILLRDVLLHLVHQGILHLLRPLPELCLLPFKALYPHREDFLLRAHVL